MTKLMTRPITKPIVIAHRGASGYRPEHTLAAYALAIEQGADFIEPDLVATKDHVLVARHENEIATTTDVAEHREFADRKATKVIDGVEIIGWFTEDFTLAELKTLRAVERMPHLRPLSAKYDRKYEIPTLEEILELAGRAVGIYPETKHPAYFQSIGLPLEEPLIETLRARNDIPVFIQSFEEANLKKLRAMTRLPLIRLLNAPVTTEELRQIRQYAAGVGPEKGLIIPRDSSNRLAASTTLVGDAHAAGLLVHAWTFRSENFFLPAECSADGEYQRFFEAGVDGVFSDHPDTAVRGRMKDEEER